MDDLPPALDADYGFASYHSKTEVNGNLIHYSRTFEVKDLSVPVAQRRRTEKVLPHDCRGRAQHGGLESHHTLAQHSDRLTKLG